jgi:hypothetical protein
LQIKEGLVMETKNNKTFGSLNDQSGMAQSNRIELEAAGGHRRSQIVMLACKKKNRRVMYWQVDRFAWDYHLLHLCFSSSHCLDLLLEDWTTSTIRAACMTMSCTYNLNGRIKMACKESLQSNIPLALWTASDCKILHPSTSCVNYLTVILIKSWTLG